MSSTDGLDFRLEDRIVGSIFIHLRQSTAKGCADLALRGISGSGDSVNTIPDAVATTEIIGAGGICLSDSGFPQSLVACIPRIDAIVSVIDEAAKVCCFPTC